MRLTASSSNEERGTKNEERFIRRHGAIVALLVGAAAVYAATLDSFGMFMWDEAEYATLSRSVLRGEGFHVGGQLNGLRPPVVPLAGALSMAISGVDDLAAKHASVAFALLALLVVYVTASAALDRVTALFAASLLAVTPELWTMTAHFLSETPYLAFFAAAVLGFELGLRRDPRWFWLAWTGFALALSTRYTAVLFAPFIVLRLGAAALFDRDSLKRLQTAATLDGRPALLAPLLAGLILLPWLVRQQLRLGDALAGFKAASEQLQIYMPDVSMPWSFYLTHLPEMLSPAIIALFIVGVAWAVWRREGFTLTCAAVTLGLLLWFSAYRYKEVRLATSILPFVAIVASAGIARILRGRWRWLLVPAAAGVFLWNHALVQPVFANWLPAGYPPFLEAMERVRRDGAAGDVIMGTSGPQIAWYADRSVVDFPREESDLAASLAGVEWVIFTNFERGQREWASVLARTLRPRDAPDDVFVYRDHRFVALVVRARYLRELTEASASDTD